MNKISKKQIIIVVISVVVLSIIIKVVQKQNPGESANYVELPNRNENPKMQLMRMMMQEQFTGGYYAVKEYLGNDKYGKETYSLLMVVFAPEKLISEMKKYNDIITLANSDLGQNLDNTFKEMVQNPLYLQKRDSVYNLMLPVQPMSFEISEKVIPNN